MATTKKQISTSTITSLHDVPQIILPAAAPIIVCYGGGVDSTAMLVAMKRQGIIPAVVTFADLGAEKPETYEQVRIVSEWLQTWAGQSVITCKKRTLDSTPYDDLEGNCVDNETLPSLAFGMKSCSIKWKQGPQDYYITGCASGPNQCEPHPVWTDSQARGVKPVKLIGYDAGPADLRRSKKLKASDAKFQYSYPLQQLGWARQDCIQAIIEEGLPVPVKSACFFCPASQKWELWWLAGNHPDLFMKALHLEHTAMMGKHSRWGSDECTYDQKWLDLINEPAGQWPTTSITVGLGRKFAWNHWAREHGIVSRDTGEFIGDREHCKQMAAALQGSGGNAADVRACA